jgi:hypothetical protein
VSLRLFLGKSQINHLVRALPETSDPQRAEILEQSSSLKSKQVEPLCPVTEQTSPAAEHRNETHIVPVKETLRNQVKQVAKV